jgi:tryptophan-rich sensory protein
MYSPENCRRLQGRQQKESVDYRLLMQKPRCKFHSFLRFFLLMEFLGVLLVFIPMIGGSLSGYVSMNNHSNQTREWYNRLPRAPWNPPRWVFGPVWTVLYLLMGLASMLIFRIHGRVDCLPLSLFGIQLILNWSWSPAFFRQRNPLQALRILQLLSIVLIPTVVLFFQESGLAGWLLVPYVVWISLALSLNWYIVKHEHEH